MVVNVMIMCQILSIYLTANNNIAEQTGGHSYCERPVVHFRLKSRHEGIQMVIIKITHDRNETITSRLFYF